MERKFRFATDEFYHVYNRGNNKSDIFLSDNDRKRFQKLLYVCNGTNPVVFRSIQGLPLDRIKKGETLVEIGAYCLMSNHFHLLLREKKDGGISQFVEKLSTGYSMYFNKRNNRTGALFEGRFKATHIDDDQYLKYLFAYIHLNPVKMIDPEWKERGVNDRKATKQYLSEYPFSSYRDYIGEERAEGKILGRDKFPQYFSNIKEFDQFINDWLAFNDERIDLV